MLRAASYQQTAWLDHPQMTQDIGRQAAKIMQYFRSACLQRYESEKCSMISSLVRLELKFIIIIQPVS